MSETKKYELTSETLQYAGHTLHRIKALRNFGTIQAGELGGWIFNCKPDMWAGDCVEHNYWLPQDRYGAHGLQLPKGSIKKLIGRELTWKDEPVELKSE